MNSQSTLADLTILNNSLNSSKIDQIGELYELLLRSLDIDSDRSDRIEDSKPGPADTGNTGTARRGFVTHWRVGGKRGI
jgi:hypothetical protein